MMRTITVTLKEEYISGYDPFNAPIYERVEVPIQGCLVAPVRSEDVVNTLSMYGKHAIYEIAIPKGDTHDWENKQVVFFGRTFQTFGYVLQGIEENIPLKWNGKVYCEMYG